MFTKSLAKMVLIACTALLSACGNIPLALTQPLVQPESQDSSVVENTVPRTEAGSGATEAVLSLPTGLTYPIVDTDQVYCYDDMSGISCPGEGSAFYGQDAQYAGVAPRYQDNEDGTVTDLVTGLMWQQNPGEKMTYDQALAGVSNFNLAGYTDWRLPTIKELYSLIQFSGADISMCADEGTCEATPFIDTEFFDFEYGDTASGERMIDSQWATSSLYTGSVFGGQQAMFGVNFADGRIKGYPVGSAGPSGRAKTFFVIYVRGNAAYGDNDFVDNGDGTVIDRATGLTWTQHDNGAGLDWEDALNYCEGLDYAGSSDWRLPNAKELQSIVDYNRSPDATNSAAIDPIFHISTITNEAGQLDYPAFWSSTTHLSSNGMAGIGVYITFGRALGFMNGQWMDVHGAGAQRAEDKSGDLSRYPTGHGPQGDAVRIYNYARCVRGGEVSLDVEGEGKTTRPSVEIQSTGIQQNQPGTLPVQDNFQSGGLSGQNQPPQEALDACLGLSQGAACTVNTPKGALPGSCLIVQSGQQACVPAGGPPGGASPP
jgi:hypothetical protein